MWIKKNLPPGLDLVLLKDLVEQVSVEWRSLPISNRQREHSSGGFAELVLNQDAVRKLRARSIAVRAKPLQQSSEQRGSPTRNT